MAPLVPDGSPTVFFTSKTNKSGVAEPAPSAPICTLAVVPEPAGCKIILPAVVDQVAAAGLDIEATPDKAPDVVAFKPPFEVKANVPVALPIVTLPVPVVATVTLLAPALAKSVTPVEVKEVNLPVPAVVAPILVLLIPVAVVLKFPAVMVRLLAPVDNEEAPKPEIVRAPLVAVKLSAPVV